MSICGQSRESGQKGHLSSGGGKCVLMSLTSIYSALSSAERKVTSEVDTVMVKILRNNRIQKLRIVTPVKYF